MMKQENYWFNKCYFLAVIIMCFIQTTLIVSQQSVDFNEYKYYEMVYFI